MVFGQKENDNEAVSHAPPINDIELMHYKSHDSYSRNIL